MKVEHNVGSSMYDVCSMEYWESAIEYITRTVENPLFFICSDNVEYVLRNLIDATKYDYVVQDNRLMIYFQGMKLYIPGLVAVVTLSFKLDPYNGDYVFIFCNRKRDSIKVLRYDQNGFILQPKVTG